MSDTAVVEETTQTAAAEEVKVDQVQETPAWYTGFAGSDEEAQAKIEYWRGLENQYTEFNEKSQKVEETLSFLSTIEEDPDEELTTLGAFKKKGIPVEFATKVLSFDAAKAESDPLDVLVLKEMVLNPSKFQKMGRAAIEEAIRDEFGIGEGEYTPTARMKSAAYDAIENINKVKGEVSVVKNPITFAKEKEKERNERVAAGGKAASEEIEKILTGLTEVTDTQGEEKFTLKVSKEDLQQILAEKDQLALLFHDKPSTKEGRAEIRKFIEDRLRIQKYLNGDVYKEWKSGYAASVKQETVKEVLNGVPDEINRSASTNAPANQTVLAKIATELGLDKKKP